MFIAFVLTMSLCPNAFAVDSAYDYLVEAENYTSCNFQSTGTVIETDTTLSGEKYLCLYTKNNGEYYAEYSVDVAESGVYDIFLASSPVEGSWSSKIYMSVNGGDAIDIFGQPGSSTTNSRIKWYGIGGANLNKGANTIRFIVRDKISSGYYSAFIDCFGLNASNMQIRYLDSEAPLNVFEETDEIAIEVNTNALALVDTTYAYSLSDVYGSVISTGNVTIKAGESKAKIVFEGLDLGYYNIEVDTVKTAFSIVKPMSERIAYGDTPFAVDTTFSGNSIPGVNKAEYAKVLGLSGVSWIRDRIWMRDSVTYKDGVYSFGNVQLQNTANLVHPYGIKISNAVERMPSNLVNDYGTYIPSNLVEVYKFWKSAAQNYGNSVDNWEILNEVDFGGAVSGWDSPDLYAAFLKAAAIGIDDGSDALVSSQGAAQGINNKNEYGKMLIRNGVYDYSAIDNTHHHKGSAEPFADYYEFSGINGVSERASVQKDFGIESPIWVTEAGIALYTASNVELTKEQQMVQAKYLVTSAVESIASGTDKHFFFIGNRFHEDTISWGMMSEDNFRPHMYRAFPAQAAMTYILGQGKYKGVIDKANNNVCAYLFNNGVNDVIVTWSKSGEQAVSFSANGKVYNMWGNEISAVSSGVSLTVTSEPVYIVCTSHTENAINNRDTQITTEKKEISDAKRVVLLQKYSDASRGGARTDGYMVSADDSTVTLEVTNLSEKTMTGNISYKTENGWKLDKESVDVTVAPMSVETVTFTITPQNGATTDYLSFVGNFDGEETSPSTVKLVETKDGIITLEAETDAKSQNGFSAYTQDGNQGLKVITTAAGEYKISFDVTSPDGGVYDLWTLGSILDYEWCSNHIIKVNGKEITPSAKNTTDSLYWNGDHVVGWNSFNDVKLKKGINTVEFSVSATRNSGDNYIVSALDKLVFVPKGLVGYREAENYTTKSGLYFTKDTSAASNGKAAELFTYYIEDPITDNTLSYDFAINENGKYDVWVLSSQANVNWLTKWKVGVDGTPDYPNPAKTVTQITTIDNQEMFWYQISDNVALNRGIHTVRFEGSEERADGGYMFHIVDAVVVVKESSNYSFLNGWTPAKTTGNIQNNKINVLKKALLTEYDLTNITDNITLPKNVEGAAISWSSNNASVVSSNGVVNRPDKGAGDASVTLTATINVDGITGTQTYNLTVKEITDEKRTPELSAEFKESKDGYSGIQMYVKNTDVLADENGNMPAVVVAKYDKTTGEFLGFVGDQHYTYTNVAGDRFVVNDNRVYCYINEAEAGTDVSFVVYKEGTKPGSETIAYANEYRGKAGNGEISFSFKTDKGEDAYRVVINKNGETYSKIIHIFEGQAIIYDENDTQDDIFVKQGVGQRVINTKGEIEMPLWQFITPENEENITYKVFLWEWYSLTPLVETIILNN